MMKKSFSLLFTMIPCAGMFIQSFVIFAGSLFIR